MDRHIRDRASALFGALAHPTRLRIVELLLGGEKTVNDTAATLGILQSSASQHLAVLARAGVLAVDQRGVSRYYRVRGPRIARILALIEEFCRAHDLYGIDAVDGAGDVDPGGEPAEAEDAGLPGAAGRSQQDPSSAGEADS